MTAVQELLRPSEAAVVSRTELSSINYAIDEHILPESLFSVEGGRRVRYEACVFISFYSETATLLTSDARRSIIIEMSGRLASRTFDWKRAHLDRDLWRVVYDKVVTVDLKPFYLNTLRGMKRLHAAQGLVVEDPEILGGIPVIRGTRVPVYDVAASLAAGLSTDRIREDYPSLTERQIELAGVYAKANPARGRPRSPQIPVGAKIVADRRASRRRRE